MTAIDYSFYESGSGGEIAFINEDIALTSGITNMVYLGLFGGNKEQNTTNEIVPESQRFDWWGNQLLNLDFNSTFERALLSTTLNSSGVSVLENAAKLDLEFMREFADVSVSGSIIGLGRFQLIVVILEPGNSSTQIKFIWDAQRKEVIIDVGKQ